MAKPKETTLEITKPRYTGYIKWADDMPALDIERGVVTILGASPNAKVTILSFDGDSRRANQVDIMRNCTVTLVDRTLNIHGESARAIHEFKLRDNVVDVTVDLSKPCADCGYS